MTTRLLTLTALLILGWACTGTEATEVKNTTPVSSTTLTQTAPAGPEVDTADVAIPDFENWFGVYIGSKKLGYAHETMTNITLDSGESGYRVSMIMKLDIMAADQLVKSNVNLVQIVDTNFDLISLDMTMGNDDQSKVMSAIRQPNSNILIVNENGREFPVDLGDDVKSETYRLAIADKLKDGDTFTYKFFDPSMSKVMSSTLEHVGTESIYFNGLDIEAKTWRFNQVDPTTEKVLLEDGIIVVDEHGQPLRHRYADFMEMRLEDEILAQSNIEGVDIFDLSAIPLLGKPDDVRLDAMDTVRVSYRGPTDLREFTSYDSQTVEGDSFVIVTTPPSEPYDNAFCSSDVSTYTADDVILTVSDEDIQERAQKLVGEHEWETVNNVVSWVFRSTTKQPSGVILSGADLIDNPRGDCKHHAILAGSLLRAANIPSRVVGGLIYLEERGTQRAGYYYHAWNEVLIGCRWYQVDPAFNESPAGANHLILDTGLDAIQSGSLVLDFLGEDVAFVYEADSGSPLIEVETTTAP